MTLTRFLMILTLALATTAASALPPRGGPGPDHPRPDLGKMLGLDGEALAKIDALTEQQHVAVFRLHREQMRAEDPDSGADAVAEAASPGAARAFGTRQPGPVPTWAQAADAASVR